MIVGYASVGNLLSLLDFGTRNACVNTIALYT